MVTSTLSNVSYSLGRNEVRIQQLVVIVGTISFAPLEDFRHVSFFFIDILKRQLMQEARVVMITALSFSFNDI
jgi:hypothetical protein